MRGLAVFAAATAAQVELPSTASVLNALGQLGAGGAVIVVVWMFLKRDREREERDKARDAELVSAISDMADRFEAKLTAIENRHYDAEREGRAQMAGLLDRNLTVTKGLAATLAEVKLTLQATTKTTEANTDEIRRLRSEMERHRRSTPDPDA